MPATGSRAARAAFDRLMARCALGLRVGSAVAAGISAFAGLGRPASAAVVAPAVAAAVGWAAAYALVVRRPRRPWWLVPADAAVAVALCLGHGRLVPVAMLPDTNSWVFLFASTTVIISQLVARPLLAAAVTVLVPGAYVAGLVLAAGADPPGGVVLLLVQGTLVAAIMAVLRRAVAAADLAVVERESTARRAAVRAARRAEEREHHRLLHDSVSATLTVVAAGGIGGSTPDLRAQARRDLAVIERLNSPPPADRADSADRADLAGWLAPVLAGAPVPVQAAVPPVQVPAAVGTALAGAVTEALTNVARHAGRCDVQVRAQAVPDGGVTVEVADDGCGFDPAAVPESRRGVRESVVGRMRAVDGSATVSSRPGGGTRVVLRWPAGAAAGDPPAGASGVLGEVIAQRYQRGFDLAVLLLVGAWHAGNDLGAMLSWWGTYRSAAVELLAWLVLAAVGVAGGVRLWRRRRTGRTGAWALAGVALLASAAGTAAAPVAQLTGGANWAWGAAGWFGALLLLRRPLRELIVFLALNSAFPVAVLAAEGGLDRLGIARAATVVYGTAALQIAFVLVGIALAGAARRAGAVAEAAAAVRSERQVADALHAGRLHRYQAVRLSVAPLLAGLAAGELDPADPRVRHRCAVEAGRLRRLFAETDDVADPLLHELRACSYIADRRGVVVDLQVLGRLPSLDRDARRALTEAPLLALAGAERHARVTVVGRSDEVAVSVLVDGPVAEAAGPVAGDPAVTVTQLDREDRRWVEARWRR